MGWTIRDVLGEERKKVIKKPVMSSFSSRAQLDEKVSEKEEFKGPQFFRDENLSTGIDLLDKNLDGGFPKGSLVCIHADPASSPEVFLYQFSTERKTYYINTSRPVFAIRKDFSNLNLDDSYVNFIDVYSIYLEEIKKSETDTDYEIMSFIINEIESFKGEKEINIVIDNLNFFMDLEVNEDLKEIFLNTLYSTAKETSGLTFVYVIKNSLDEKTLNKIFDISDVIMEIFIEISGSRYVKKFGIPKIRGRTPLTDLFKFEIGEGIHLDTSKDIA